MIWMMAFALVAPGAVVLQPAANLYSRPSPEADVVSQALYGSYAEVLEEQGEWRRIRTPDDYTGWAPASALRRLADGERPYGSGARAAEVASLFANIYREPDVTRRQPLLTLPFEARLEIIAEPEDQPRWTQVRLADDRSGWVQRGDLGAGPARLTVEQTIAFSKRFLGLPYLWGGTSAFGYDCSGFTQMLCRRRGMALPRDAAPQARWSGSVAVDRGALQPGDLLYFGDSAERITHTGMYLGEGRFIHATAHSEPVVQISDLGDPHWTALLVSAKRIP
jgi:cell wall-associated NlpC family hydrolase